MRIVGHGIDLVETQRIGRMIAEHGDRFLLRVFTEGERRYAAANPSRRVEHLAGRFAAKEAVLKVLGTGWAGGITWTDAEVVREPSGKPAIVLHGRALEVAGELGIEHWWLSISHVSTHAMASAIGAAGR
jgi:holo-[acyl-carrier protein] synthase